MWCLYPVPSFAEIGYWFIYLIRNEFYIRAPARFLKSLYLIR